MKGVAKHCVYSGAKLFDSEGFPTGAKGIVDFKEIKRECDILIYLRVPSWSVQHQRAPWGERSRAGLG